MEKIILVILSVLCLVSCKQSEKKNDLTEENLKGKVKSITENTYEAVDKFGQIEKGDVSYYAYAVTIYNEKGNKIEENHYNSYGMLYEKYTYKYDENGNNIEECHYEDGILSKKHTYKYDENGNNIQKRRYYYKNGKFNSKSSYTYKYDENGNNIEECHYLTDGKIDYKTTYKYDEKGNKIEICRYDYDNLSYKYTYKYDEKGNNIEKNKYYSSGNLNYKSTYKYDENGNKIEENSYDFIHRFDYKDTYKYEYDKNNNWIQQVTYENNKPTQIKERIIEYYP